MRALILSLTVLALDINTNKLIYVLAFKNNNLFLILSFVSKFKS